MHLISQLETEAASDGRERITRFGNPKDLMHTATRARLAGQLVGNLLQKAKGPTLGILEPFLLQCGGAEAGYFCS